MRCSRPRRLLLCEEMFLAWLAGEKTQTRRVVVPQPNGAQLFVEDGRLYRQDAPCPQQVCAPLGPAGRRLAVCEPFRVQCRVQYYPVRGDTWVILAHKWGDRRWSGHIVPRTHLDMPTSQAGDRFHSPRYMPVWAARHWTRVVAVRVERLQAISEKQSLAEGVGGGVSGFRDLWDRLNARRGYGWAANPWVWVYTLAKPGDAP